MSLEQLTGAERDRIVALKLRHAYERADADEVITVTDLVDGQLVERPASFDESWAPLRREIGQLPPAADDEPTLS